MGGTVFKPDLIEAMIKDVWRHGEHAVPLSPRQACEIRQALMTMLSQVTRSGVNSNVLPFKVRMRPPGLSPPKWPDPPLRMVGRK